MTVNYKLTGKTTREQLERFGKDTIVEIAEANGIATDRGRNESKRNLIDAMMGRVLHFIAEEQEVAAQAEKARLETLAAERAAGRVHEALVNFRASVEEATAGPEKALAEFQSKVAEGQIGYALEWKAEGVFHALRTLREFAGLQNYVGEQIADQTRTSGEIGRSLADLRDRLLEQCLQDGYRHCSTSEMDSVKARAEFKAVQDAAKWFRAAVQAWERVTLEGREPIELACVRAR